MEPGYLVEYIDRNKIICAVILEVKKLRLRLLTEHNREVKLAASRLVHHTPGALDVSQSRSNLVTELKARAARRRALAEAIDIRELWEILNSEQEWIDLNTMVAFCFQDEADADGEAAVIRAFFSDRVYFKFKMNQFRPHTAEQVDAIERQKAAEQRRQRIINAAALWMTKVAGNGAATAPEDSETICDLLASYYLYDKESPHRDMAKAIVKKAGADGPSSIFTFLTAIGHWHPDENLDLLRYAIRADFSPAILARTEALCRNRPVFDNGRIDLRQLDTITIDGPLTTDFDDALSIETDDTHHTVGIHIADVGHFIHRGDPLDQVAAERCSSIYMPDGKIAMLPPMLSDDACSLRVDQERPAISTMLKVTDSGRIEAVEIVPSIIRVNAQRTFQQIDAMAAEDPQIRTLYAIAKQFRQQRVRNGALLIDLPEINIQLTSEGTPSVSMADRESPGRMLVSELMILANAMAAQFLKRNNLPAIFRSQPPPRERLINDSESTLFQNWMQRKLINRFILGSTPEPHAGLGLESYVTATSPIRKYSDLVTQRQLRAAAGLEDAYSQDEIDAVIAASEQTLLQVGRTQFRRHRYWLLKYLQGRIGSKEEALVLYKRRDGYMVLLRNYMIECRLSGAEGITLRPEDEIRVTLQHVHARNDILTVVLG